MSGRPTSRVVPALFVAVMLLVVLGATACGGSSSDKLSLVAYSTPQEAYQKIIPAFQKTSAGKDVTFSQSYGASGDQSRAVAAGLSADIVALSLEPDVSKLVDAGKVPADWNKNSYNGFVTNSVVVLATRKGNPKNIRTFDDLIKPGVQVITPNPFTSGGARWNVMAAYGAQIGEGKTQQQAVDYLGKLFKNVPVQDKAARDSLQTFAGGKGDVLIAYENEAITAQKKGIKLDYVIPDRTILIQNPVAVTSGAKPADKAKAFVDFLHSAQAQRIFSDNGYRPVIPSLVDKSRYPTPSGLFEITKFGGWSKVSDQFFDPDKGIMAKVEQSLGVSTSK
jgi:sulfate/thiosulfate transport system substrate-binding protein